MTGVKHETMVKGTRYTYWADYMLRGMIARNEETGETLTIKLCGYLSNDLAVRKAIANAFNIDSFRK